MLKILICDDSILMRRKLRESIELCCKDVQIIEAKDGNLAVQMYMEHRPGLVFMDIVMPEKDGIQAVREIKEYDANAKVVMASSTGTQSNLRKAIEAGAYEFVQKPWEQSTIESIISKLISERV
jgi:two-component system, chemotaxis family, chemotaxis protein CheY